MFVDLRGYAAHFQNGLTAKPADQNTAQLPIPSCLAHMMKIPQLDRSCGLGGTVRNTPSI